MFESRIGELFYVNLHQAVQVLLLVFFPLVQVQTWLPVQGNQKCKCAAVEGRVQTVSRSVLKLLPVKVTHSKLR